MSLTIESAVRLSSGAFMPRLGFGIFKATGKECEESVKVAAEVGYRHFDSAVFYHNEQEMAQGLASTRIPRNKLFLTTKFFPSGPPQPAKQVTDGLRTSLKKLDQFGGKGYIDLVLIHAPYGGPEGRARHWEGLVNAQKEGWVKDIGVSNFGVKHLKELPGPTPAINQIELHPWCQQRDIVSYCQQNGVIVQAYCPLVRADKKRLEDPVVTKIAEKHGKQGSHVILRWSLQKGFVPLPKSVTPSRIKSNADLYDFVLDEEDMKELDSLDEGAAGACSWNPVNEE